MPIALNEDIAGRLDEMARLLAEQGANRFRVQAYHQAASVLRELERPISEIFAEERLEGLEKLPGLPAKALGSFSLMTSIGCRSGLCFASRAEPAVAS